jgi:hypothetical protein
MLRSEAITEIKVGLGFRQTQDTTIIRALKEAQRILELGHTLPDWLIEYDSPITVTADDPEVTLPTRFIRFHDDYQLYYTNSDSARVFIPRRNYTEAYQAYVASGEEDDSVDSPSSSYPQVVVQQGQTAGLLIPTPTVSFTAYLTYYKGAEVLDTDIENGWLANTPDVLIGIAGMRVAMILRDKGAMEQFNQRANLGGKAALGQIIEQELAGRGLVMGRNN